MARSDKMQMDIGNEESKTSECGPGFENVEKGESGYYEFELYTAGL